MTFFRKLVNSILTRQEIESLLFLEIIAGVILSFFTLTLFIFVTNQVTQEQTLVVDRFISETIFSLRSAALTKIMTSLSYLGSEGIIFSSVVITIFLTIRKHRKETFIFSLLLLMGVVATTALKLTYERPRPLVQALAIENTYSYPSGHALNSIIFYATISYFTYHFTKKRGLSTLVTIFSAILIFLIGLSRIYLGVHHPSDIAAGYVMGFWIFATTILADKTITYFRLIRETANR